MKTYYLAFEIGSLQKTIYPLLGPTTIGRSSDNTISLPDPTSSRNHAKVHFEEGEGGWVVEDLGSANGIIYCGERVETVVLKSGDAFQIGGISFRFIEKKISKESEQLFETVEILTSSSEKAALEAPVQEGAETLAESKPAAEAELEKEPPAGRVKPWAERLQDAVSAIPFFSPLDDKECKKLADAATLHVFNAGEMIIREGDPGRSIFTILDGKVRVFTNDYHGEELAVATLEVSQFFGEMSFLTGKPRSSSVAALDTSVLLELNYTSMRNLVKDHPDVKRVLLEYYNERVGTAAEKRAEKGMEERKRDPRLREKLPVRLVVLPQTTPTGELAASTWDTFSADISAEGVVVALLDSEPDSFHPEGQVRLEIVLPEPWGEIRTLGVIRRVKPIKKEKKMTLVGIEFEGMAETDSQKLDEFIHGERHV